LQHVRIKDETGLIAKLVEAHRHWSLVVSARWREHLTHDWLHTDSTDFWSECTCISTKLRCRNWAYES